MELGWRLLYLQIKSLPERTKSNVSSRLEVTFVLNLGRIEAQKDENGNVLGPLRVWTHSMQMPGLAMTRSFGDKAGIRAGTNAIPEVLQHVITPNDKYFVVASDGIWEYIENEELMNLLTPYY